MKSFIHSAAQGDVLITRINHLPEGLRKNDPVGGKFIIAHSETGHHHTVAERHGVSFLSGKDPMIAYLDVIDSVEVTLDHERTFDTHESLLLKGGTYEIRRQQEYTPEGWRRVAD
jgi:hypothetical protein